MTPNKWNIFIIIGYLSVAWKSCLRWKFAHVLCCLFSGLVRLSWFVSNFCYLQQVTKPCELNKRLKSHTFLVGLLCFSWVFLFFVVVFIVFSRPLELHQEFTPLRSKQSVTKFSSLTCMWELPIRDVKDIWVTTKWIMEKERTTR